MGISAVATLLLSSNLWAADVTPSSVDPALRVSIAREMASQNLLRVATCREAVSSFLKSLELPAIGETGQRRWIGRIDRKRQYEARPVLIDENFDSSTHVKSRLESDENDNTLTVSLTRERMGKAHGRLRTEIRFKIGESQGGQSCDVATVEFSYLDGRQHPTATPLLKTTDCLEPFANLQFLLSSSSAVDRQISEWIKRDCALASRYAESIHRAASGEVQLSSNHR